LKKLNFFSFILLSITVSIYSQQQTSTNTCISCHQDQDPPLSTPVEQFKTSVHNISEISCAGCHGGDATAEDPDVAMSKAKGFVGKPSSSQIPKFCSRCHSDVTYMRKYNPKISTDQYDRYLTSQHGLLLKKGDKKVATCISCHGVHDIKRADDPRSPTFATNIADRCGHCHANAEYMKDYSINTNQLTEYKTSVHAKMLYDKGDLSAPTCNDCHGNHGAVPPGLTSIANVCGTCHLVQSEYFSSSPHKQAFDDMGFSECEACHGNHAIQAASDAMIGTQEPATCIQCHDEGTSGYEAAVIIRSAIDSLALKIQMAEQMFNRAQRAGVEIKDEEMNLPNAKDALVQVRALVHTFSIEKIKEKTKEGVEAANNALAIGKQGLHELSHRRRMLIVMVVLTLLVAGFLVLYIRYREKTN